MQKQEKTFVAKYFTCQQSTSIFVILLFSFCFTNQLKATLFWDITIVDPSGGGRTSMVVLPSGHPAISYSAWGLKYAWFDGTEWHTNYVEQDTHAGSNSMIILPTGQPAISYVNYTNKLLKYAEFNGTNWQITEVSTVGSLGTLCSTNLITLSSDQPAISYFTGMPDSNLKFAWLDDNTWYNTVIDNAVGFTFSMACLPSGQPAIAYRKNLRLMYAWHEGNDFTTNWNIVEIPGSGDGSGYDASLAILPTGYPAISHTTPGGGYPWLKYTWFDGATWHTTDIDIGDQSNLEISPTGEPAISYQGNPEHRNGYICAFNEPDSCLVLTFPKLGTLEHDIDTVDTMGGWIGDGSSLVFLPSGKPAISYDGWGLRYATQSDIPDAPVSMTANCTATAWTELWSGFGWDQSYAGPGHAGASSGGVGETSYDGMDPYIEPATIAYVNFYGWSTYQLYGLINLDGSDGEECVAWDDWELDCTESTPVSCGDASGKVAGTIDIETSEELPTGTEMGLSLEVRNLGYSSDGGEYYFKLWRGGSLLAQIDSSTPDPDCVNILAGDTLSFEFFAAEKDDYGDEVSYHRGLEFRGILRQSCSLGTIKVITDLNDARFTLYGPSIVLSGYGLNWQKTGVPTGDYKVVLEDVPGYITPDDQTGTLDSDGTLIFTTSYVYTGIYTLTIATVPVAGEIFIDGQSKGTGSWSGTVEAGQHMISFGDYPGYIKPLERQVIVGSEPLQIINTYTAIPGTVIVNTNLNEACYSVMFPDGIDHNSQGRESTFSDCPVGEYSINYDNVEGYITPDSQTEIMQPNGVVVFSSIYFPELSKEAEVLAIPYYDQGDSDWCYASSMAMMATCYSSFTKPWQVATIFNKKPPDELRLPELVQMYEYLREKIGDYSNNAYTLAFDLGGIPVIHPISLLEQIRLKGDLIEALGKRKPVMLWYMRLQVGWPLLVGHFVIVVGADESTIWLHNPGTDLPRHMPITELSWDEFFGTIGDSLKNLPNSIKNVSALALTLTPDNPLDEESKPLTLSFPFYEEANRGTFEFVRTEDKNESLKLCWDGSFKHGYVFTNCKVTGSDFKNGIWKLWTKAYPDFSPHNSDFFQIPTSEFDMYVKPSVVNTSDDLRLFHVEVSLIRSDVETVEWKKSTYGSLVARDYKAVPLNLGTEQSEIYYSLRNLKGDYLLRLRLYDVSKPQISILNDELTIQFSVHNKSSL